jgi:hypothetical protein
MIYKTITNDYEFAEWVKRSDSYSNNFSFEGAKALQDYLEQLSDDIGENIEFDPIAWCCEFSEYEDYADAWQQLGNGTYIIEGEELAIDDNVKLWLENNTTVIEFDGGIIVRDF